MVRSSYLPPTGAGTHTHASTQLAHMDHHNADPAGPRRSVTTDLCSHRGTVAVDQVTRRIQSPPDKLSHCQMTAYLPGTLLMPIYSESQDSPYHQHRPT